MIDLAGHIYPTTQMVRGQETAEQHIEDLIKMTIEHYNIDRRCDSVLMQHIFDEAVRRVKETEAATWKRNNG